MRKHNAHASRSIVKTVEEMHHEGVITLGCRRNAPVKAMERVQVGRHLRFFVIFSNIAQEATIPLIKRERRVGHDALEFHQLVVLDIARVRERVTLPNHGIINSVQEHVHAAESPSLHVLFLAVNTSLAVLDLRKCLEQQASASAGAVVNAVVFLGLHQARDKF